MGLLGLFGEKNKIYSLKAAMTELEKLEKRGKYNYTTKPEGNGYRIVTQEEVAKDINQYKVNRANQGNFTENPRKDFLNEISGNGIYKNMDNTKRTNNVVNYNNWQAAKNYQKRKDTQSQDWVK